MARVCSKDTSSFIYVEETLAEIIYTIGSGSELDNAKKLDKELKTDNVIFCGQRPLEDMSGLYINHTRI